MKKERRKGERKGGREERRKKGREKKREEGRKERKQENHLADFKWSLGVAWLGGAFSPNLTQWTESGPRVALKGKPKSVDSRGKRMDEKTWK